MSRSLKKGPYVDEKLFAKVEKLVESGSHEPPQAGRLDRTLAKNHLFPYFKSNACQ